MSPQYTGAERVVGFPIDLTRFDACLFGKCECLKPIFLTEISTGYSLSKISFVRSGASDLGLEVEFVVVGRKVSDFGSVR